MDKEKEQEQEVKEEEKKNKKEKENRIPPSVPIVEIENDIEINLINSSSDSYVQSEDDDDDEDKTTFTSQEITQTTVELFPQSSYESISDVEESRIAPKKSIKRMVSHSPISSKVYKSASFSPSSRMKIYQNETRLSSLLNGFGIDWWING